MNKIGVLTFAEPKNRTQNLPKLRNCVLTHKIKNKTEKRLQAARF